MSTFDSSQSVATPVPKAPTAPPAPNAPVYGGADLSRSPSYLAYLRGAGLNEAQARAQVAKRQATLGASLEAQRPMWAQQLTQGFRNANTNAASRGTMRSSNRLDNQNEVQQAVDLQRAAAEGQVAEQRSALEDQLQGVLLQNERGKADAAAQAQMSAYEQSVKSYENQLANHYLQQMLGGQ